MDETHFALIMSICLLLSGLRWRKYQGDGMTMFDDCTLLLDEVALDNQVLINYITGALDGEIGEEYANP